MKTIFITLAILLGLSSGVLSQKRDFHPTGRYNRRHKLQNYLTISGTYRIGFRKYSVCEAPLAYQKNPKTLIETNYRTRNYHLIVTIHNTNTAQDFAGIVYAAQFYTGDGVYEGMQTLTTDDTVSMGATITLKKQRLKCPKDCRAVTLAIIQSSRVVKN